MENINILILIENKLKIYKKKNKIRKILKKEQNKNFKKFN